MKKPRIARLLWKSFLIKAGSKSYEKADMSLLNFREKMKKEGKTSLGVMLSPIKN